MQKKLMIVIWHMGIGGMQKRIRDISFEIQREKPQWQLILLVKHEKKSFFVEEMIKGTNVKVEYFSKSHWWSNSILSVFWLIKKYAEIKPDVVLTFLDHLSVLMVWIKILLRSKAKLILNESMLTTKYVEMSRGRMANLWKYLVRTNYKKADLIIVPTMACKLDLVDNFEVDEKLIKMIPNWTMFELENSEVYKYDLVFVGRLEYEKGIESLLDLAIDLKKYNLNFKLAVVGDGEKKDWFMEQIEKEKLKNNIDFLGYTAEVKRILLESKILVLPTLNEGLPNVVLEAGMCGVPTVANRFDGVGELIENGKTGFIVESVTDMSLRVRELLEDEGKRRKIGERIQNVVTKEFGKKKQEEFVFCLVA